MQINVGDRPGSRPALSESRILTRDDPRVPRGRQQCRGGRGLDEGALQPEQLVAKGDGAAERQTQQHRPQRQPLAHSGARLDRLDPDDFERARRGLLAQIPDGKIDGTWDLSRYAFLDSDEPDPAVHPSLWRQSRLNAVHGLFENARRARLGLGRADYARAMGALFAPFSAVAAANPCSAAEGRAQGAEELVAITERNRLVADPYPLRLVARDQVNQGAALLVMEEGAARAAGHDPARVQVRKLDVRREEDWEAALDAGTAIVLDSPIDPSAKIDLDRKSVV